MRYNIGGMLRDPLVKLFLVKIDLGFYCTEVILHSE